MREKPLIEDAALLSALLHHYNLSAAKLFFVPIGDSAYSYVVQSQSGSRFYLKVFDGTTNKGQRGAARLELYLPVTRELWRKGLFPCLTYPIPTTEGTLCVTYGHFTLALFNYIAGRTLADAYPLQDDVLGRIAEGVANIHRTTRYLPSSMLRPLSDTFDVSFTDALLEQLAIVTSYCGLSSTDVVMLDLTALILPVKNDVLSYVDTLRKVSQEAAIAQVPRVLCHGDVWGGNLVETSQGNFVFLDWEAATLAPIERDVFGFIGDGFPIFRKAYEQASGEPLQLHTGLLKYYAYRHHLRNLTQWLQNLLFEDYGRAQRENDLEMIQHHCLNRFAIVDDALSQIQRCHRE